MTPTLFTLPPRLSEDDLAALELLSKSLGEASQSAREALNSFRSAISKLEKHQTNDSVAVRLFSDALYFLHRSSDILQLDNADLNKEIGSLTSVKRSSQAQYTQLTRSKDDLVTALRGIYDQFLSAHEARTKSAPAEVVHRGANHILSVQAAGNGDVLAQMDNELLRLGDNVVRLLFRNSAVMGPENAGDADLSGPFLAQVLEIADLLLEDRRRLPLLEKLGLVPRQLGPVGKSSNEPNEQRIEQSETQIGPPSRIVWPLLPSISYARLIRTVNESSQHTVDAGWIGRIASQCELSETVARKRVLDICEIALPHNFPNHFDSANARKKSHFEKHAQLLVILIKEIGRRGGPWRYSGGQKYEGGGYYVEPEKA